MKNSTNITIEALSTLLNSKVWTKGEINRIYINRGYNTKKMSTTTYVYMAGEEIKVNCFVECYNQPVQWGQSQANEVIERVESEIADLIKKSENPKKWANLPYSKRVKYVVAPSPVAVPVVNQVFESTFESTFEIGEKYSHEKFGVGTITTEDKDTMVIAFENFGEKKLIKKFVRLQKVA